MRTLLRLLPLLIVHVLIIVMYSQGHPGLVQGENRYVADAKKLVEPRERIMERDLVPWNGPGYPLFLVPFVLLHAPPLILRFANAILFLLGALYIIRALRYYVAEKWAFVAVYLLGLYPVLLKYLPRIFTEPLSIFLACGFVFHAIHMNRTSERRKLHLVLAGVYFGYLALTKVLFGYVIAAAIVVYLLALLVSRKHWVVRALMVACIALAVCVPYLYRTYSLTGRIFYWAQSGGLSLYWMSSPVGEEYGDWLTGTRPWVGDYWRSEKHHEFLESLRELSPVERDQTLRKEAIQNMLDHPGKFAKNWGANVTRLFLHYPYSYKQHAMEDLRTVLPGSILLVLCVACMIPTVADWRRFPEGFKQVVLVGLLYVGGSSVLSAYDRMLLPVLPIMAVWLTYTLAHAVRPGCLHLRFYR